MFLTKEGIIKWKREGIRPTITLEGGELQLSFSRIPSPCPHGGRWGKTLIGALYFVHFVLSDDLAFLL